MRNLPEDANMSLDGVWMRTGSPALIPARCVDALNELGPNNVALEFRGTP